MALRRRSTGPVAGSVLALSTAFTLFACGDDDNGRETVIIEQGDAGAPSAYPPALGPDDCALSTSPISLSQPEGAAVWGGLVLLEFEVDGARVDSFDVQAFDPAIDGWVSAYVRQETVGQRDDGSYFMVLRPTFNEANRDSELKLRVRPNQAGCPDGEWTETEAFAASEPLPGTAWEGTIPAGLFSNNYVVQRSSLPGGDVLPSTTLSLGDVTLAIELGSKGEFIEVVTVPLVAEEDEPFAGCTLTLTFEASYSVLFRRTYEGVWLAVTDQRLTSIEGEGCIAPEVEQLTAAAEDADVRLPAYTQGIDINYLPLLYAEPAAARWEGPNVSQLFAQLGQMLRYQTPDELGSVDGYVYPQDVVLEQTK